MTKFLWKGIKGLLLLAILVYLLLLWKLKSGIDSFIESQPGNQTLDYYWLWVDWNASLYTKDVKLLDDNDEVMARAEIIKIEFESWRDLLSLNDLVTYQRFPEFMRVFVIKGNTTKEFKLFDYLQASKLRFEKQIIPSNCRQTLQISPTPFLFEASNEFKFDEIAGTLKIHSLINTVGFANFDLSTQVDNLAYNDYNSAFVSSFQVKASQLSWLQQSLNLCKTQTAQTDLQLVKSFAAQIRNVAKENYLLLNPDFIKIYSEFVFSPLELSISYAPQIGYRWQQLLNIPLHQLKPKTRAKLTLNGKPVDRVFDTFDYLGFNRAQNEENQKASPTTQNSYLPVSFSGLSNFVGTKVVLNLDSKVTVQGVIEEVRRNQLLLSQFKFGGKSVLPYKFSDIRSIEVSQFR